MTESKKIDLDPVVESERLVLRRLTADDAAFILELVNEPSWIANIGDKGVRTLEDARAYIAKGPVEMYARLGFGLFLTQRKEDGASIGMCGLIKRDSLADVDIGFAFLPKFWGQGYAREAASATLGYAKSALGLRRVVAITSLGNERSIKLLETIGFVFERTMELSAGDDVKLFGREL